MAEQQQQQLNGYLTASQLLTEAINQAYQAGITVDEMFAALKVQSEVVNLRLTQVLFENQQREAMRIQQEQAAAQQAQQDLPLEDPKAE